MANFDAYTTSNYFHVNDKESFFNELEKINGDDFFVFDGDTFSVAVYDTLCSYDSKDNEYDHDDYCKLIQKHMLDDERIFISTIGHEKLNYLAADCTIITKHEIIYKDLFGYIEKGYNNGKSIF